MAVEQITYKNIDHKTRRMIMAGLCFAMLIACFDGTIVGTCGTVIATELQGLDLYAWMVTAFMLCETVMIPISGKLSDLYGRKPLFLVGLTIFVLGSFAAGASFNMEMLIICRAVQGLGGGILIPVATAAVADLYEPRARAKMQGALGAIFGIGSGVGPLIGGFITENIDWRWIFYINIPLAIISYVLTIKKFPTPFMDQKPIIDYVGIALLSALLVDVLLLFEFAGSMFEWTSITAIGMIILALFLTGLFVIVERRVVEPLLSPKLLKNRTVVMAAIYMFIFGVGMMGAMIYSNMFVIIILGLDTMQAGIYMLALIVGMMITAISSGHLLNRTGYKLWLTAGPLICFFSLYLMSTMSMGTDLTFYVECLFLLGLGLGCMMAVIMTGVQNSSKMSEIGMSTSAVNLLRSVGATMGTAIFSMLIASKLSHELMDHVSPQVYDIIPHDTGVLNILGSEDFIQQLIAMGEDVATVIMEILVSFANSVDFAFIAGGSIMAIMAVIGILYKVQKPEEEDFSALIREMEEKEKQ